MTTGGLDKKGGTNRKGGTDAEGLKIETLMNQ